VSPARLTKLEFRNAVRDVLGVDMQAGMFLSNDPEGEAADDVAKFITDALEAPYIIGLFLCKLWSDHKNDANFFVNRATRTCLQPGGTPTPTARRSCAKPTLPRSRRPSTLRRWLEQRQTCRESPTNAHRRFQRTNSNRTASSLAVEGPRRENPAALGLEHPMLHSSLNP
jgi:hypothetical protein